MRSRRTLITTLLAGAIVVAGCGATASTGTSSTGAATDDGRDVALCETAVVETKSAGAAGPADRVLWELGVRPARVSKFCTSLAAMRPELPANRWTRALHRPWVTGATGLRLPDGGGVLALASSG